MTPPRNRAIRAACVAVTLLLLVILADRGADRLAEQRARAHVANAVGVQGRSDVQVNKLPFLTQLLRRDLDDVQVHVDSIERLGVRLTDVNMRLRGVHPSLVDGLMGRYEDVPLDHVNGTAQLTYGDLQKALDQALAGLPLITVSGSSAGLEIGLPGLSALLGNVKLNAHLEGGKLQLGVASALAPAGLAEALTRISLPLPPLPYGLTLTELRFGDNGISLSVAGRDTRFPTQ